MPNTSYDTDLTDTAWALVEPLLPAAKTGGRPRTTDTRAVLNGIFYLLRSGCQWRLLPHEFPPWGTVYYYFRSWDNAGVWVHLQRALYEQTRVAAGRETCPRGVALILDIDLKLCPCAPTWFGAWYWQRRSNL
jgi:putative transposase